MAFGIEVFDIYMNACAREAQRFLYACHDLVSPGETVMIGMKDQDVFCSVGAVGACHGKEINKDECHGECQ